MPQQTLLRLLRDRVGGEARIRGTFIAAILIEDLRRADGLLLTTVPGIADLRAAVAAGGHLLRPHKATCGATGRHIERAVVDEDRGWPPICEPSHAPAARQTPTPDDGVGAAGSWGRSWSSARGSSLRYNRTCGALSSGRCEAGRLPLAPLVAARQGAVGRNTAYSERLNGPFRDQLRAVPRHSRRTARHAASVHAGG